MKIVSAPVDEPWTGVATCFSCGTVVELSPEDMVFDPTETWTPLRWTCPTCKMQQGFDEPVPYYASKRIPMISWDEIAQRAKNRGDQ